MIILSMSLCTILTLALLFLGNTHKISSIPPSPLSMDTIACHSNKQATLTALSMLACQFPIYNHNTTVSKLLACCCKNTLHIITKNYSKNNKQNNDGNYRQLCYYFVHVVNVVSLFKKFYYSKTCLCLQVNISKSYHDSSMQVTTFSCLAHVFFSPQINEYLGFRGQLAL